jgi:hypothetical protein
LDKDTAVKDDSAYPKSRDQANNKAKGNRDGEECAHQCSPFAADIPGYRLGTKPDEKCGLATKKSHRRADG